MRAPQLIDGIRQRAERSTIDFHVRRLELFQEQPRSRARVEIRRFSDTVVATAVPMFPDLDWMQHVGGLAPGDETLVGEIVEWYRGLGLRPRFEIAPTGDFEPLAAALAAAGACQTGFIDLLWAPAGRPSEGHTAPGVDVRKVEPGSADAVVFARVYLAGHGVPDDGFTERWKATESWAQQPGWSCYVASVDGTPAGGAVLAIANGVGYFAGGSTMPPARGRGCQQALISRRLQEAEAAGCDIVASLAGPATSSHRNLERGGLGVAFTNVMWTVME